MLIRWLIALLAAACLAVALVACGGDDNTPSSTDSSASPTSSLPALYQQLSSVLLQQSDLPVGLEGGSPSFSTNDSLSNGDQNQLATLAAVGRQLGVDIQFIPTDRLDPGNPVRGGVESSASVYTTSSGASQTFQQTAESARQNDWKANYPSYPDLTVTEVQQKIGDESLWLRLNATAECTFNETPTPGAGGVVPSVKCTDQKRLFIDNVLFRSGRVRGYLQVSGLVALSAPPEAFEDQILQWAQLMVQRGQATFGS